MLPLARNEQDKYRQRGGDINVWVVDADRIEFDSGHIYLTVDGVVGDKETSAPFEAICDIAGPYQGRIAFGTLSLKLLVHVDWRDVIGTDYGRMQKFIWDWKKVNS